MRGGCVRVPVLFPNTIGEWMPFMLLPSILFAPIPTFMSYGDDLAHGDDFSFKVALLAYLYVMLSAVAAMCALYNHTPSLCLPYLTFLTLDLFIGIFSICSLFVRIPPCLGFMEYLNWRWPTNALYMYNKPGVVILRTAGEVLRDTRGAIFLALYFVALLLLKFFYVVMVGWRGYKVMKFGRWEEKQLYDSTINIDEFVLRLGLQLSNDKAVALPVKKPPPPAYSV